MSDTNDLSDFISASLRTALDEIYQRLVDCNFGLENPELEMFTVALLVGREVVLMFGFGNFGIAKRSITRRMRWRRGATTGHDLAREPGLGDQKDYRLEDMSMPVQSDISAHPLFGSKGSRDGPAYSADSPTAAPPSMKVKMNEIEIKTAETKEILEKRVRDWHQL